MCHRAQTMTHAGKPDGVIMHSDQCRDHRGEPGSLREYAVVKRSVVVGGHKTSVSLEDAFWTSLKDIAIRRGMTLSTQIASIDTDRKTSNLSSAIRLFVLEHFRTRAVSTMFIGERQAPSTRLAPLGS
jgi:predicted DNA-binding ribbon-helix-helix protein